MLKRLQSQPLLWKVSVLHLVLALAALVGIVVDTRTVGGINPWIKPLKFDLSITVYLWTMAWILSDLSTGYARKIGNSMAICMLIETLMVGTQALRGVRSHFNIDTSLDSAVFMVMGLVILYNFWLILRVTLKFLRGAFTLPRPYLRGIQCGLVSLIVGNLFGIYMSQAAGHSVGAPDGGLGLPFLNWSRLSGDLRVAHFAGMHGIQLLVFLGWYLSRPMTPIPEDAGVMWMNLSFALYAGFCVFLFVQAVNGVAFIG